MTEAQLKEIINKYWGTFDLPSHKWVTEMTEAELKARGYLPKDPEKTQATVTKKASSRSTSK